MPHYFQLPNMSAILDTKMATIFVHVFARNPTQSILCGMFISRIVSKPQPVKTGGQEGVGECLQVLNCLVVGTDANKEELIQLLAAGTASEDTGDKVIINRSWQTGNIQYEPGD